MSDSPPPKPPAPPSPPGLPPLPPLPRASGPKPNPAVATPVDVAAERSPLPTITLRGVERPVTRLALGTWGLGTDAYGATPSDGVVRSRVRAAWKRGIRAFDVAALWDSPRVLRLIAEELGDAIGEAHVFARVGRETHEGRLRASFGADTITEAADELRELLGPDTGLSLLLHAPPGPLLNRDDVLGAFRALRDEGIVTAIGASCTIGAAAVEGLERGFDHVAVPYNVIHSDAVNEVDESFPPAEGESAACVVAHSVLMHGVLAASVPAGHVYPLDDHRRARWTEEALRTRLGHARALWAVLDTGEVPNGVANLVGLALRFVLSHPRVGVAVVAPRSEEQLDALISSLDDASPLTEPVQHELLRVLPIHRVDTVAGVGDLAVLGLGVVHDHREPGQGLPGHGLPHRLGAVRRPRGGVHGLGALPGAHHPFEAGVMFVRLRHVHGLILAEDPSSPTAALIIR